MRAALGIAVASALAAFGAGGLALALFGAGLPFGLADLVAAGLAALVVFAAARAAFRGERARAMHLTDRLRDVLSPALIVSDRLTRHPDPAIRRAGVAVVRTVERAVAVMTGERPPVARDEPAAGTPPPPPPDGRSAPGA